MCETEIVMHANMKEFGTAIYTRQRPDRDREPGWHGADSGMKCGEGRTVASARTPSSLRLPDDLYHIGLRVAMFGQAPGSSGPIASSPLTPTAWSHHGTTEYLWSSGLPISQTRVFRGRSAPQ
jgi:hypothetical protein